MAVSVGVFGDLGHGKSSLVHALTVSASAGYQASTRSSELSFHVLETANGSLSLLEAPGHPRYHRHLVAGILSTDLAILCIDIKAGITPATIEQITMLRLRQVQGLIFVFTKSDLANAHRVTVLETELREQLAGTPFQDNLIVPVSALKGEGLDLLQLVIEQMAVQMNLGTSSDWFINVWSVAGKRGKISLISGVVEGGPLKLGDPAELVPNPGDVNMASIRCFSESIESAEHGTQVVVELRGTDPERIERGSILALKGVAQKVVTIAFRPTWNGEPKNNTSVKVYIGLQELLAKIVWDAQDPHVAKLELKDEGVAALGQQILVTKLGPNGWLAGGPITSVTAEQHKLGDSLRFVEVTNLEEGILAAVHDDPDGVTTEKICKLIGRSPQQLGQAFENLLASKRLVGFAGLWYQPQVFLAQANKFLSALDELHESQPSVLAHEREAIVKKAGLQWFGKHLDRMLSNLEELGKIEIDGKRIKRSDFRLTLRQHQVAFLERVIQELDKTLINNPYPSEIASALGAPIQAVEEIMNLGVLSGHLLRLSPSLVYSLNQIETLKKKTLELFEYEEFTAIEFKDAMESSRKFAIPVLDHFDAIGFTDRKTEKRRIRKS